MSREEIRSAAHAGIKAAARRQRWRPSERAMALAAFDREVETVYGKKKEKRHGDHER